MENNNTLTSTQAPFKFLSVIIKSPSKFFTDFDKLNHKNCTLIAFLCIFFGFILSYIISLLMIDIIITNLPTYKDMLLPFADTLNISKKEFSGYLLKELHIAKNVSIISLFLAPFTAYFLPHLISGFLYFILKHSFLYKKIEVDLSKIYAAICYCMIPMLFIFIPILGAFLMPAWSLFLIIIALRNIYQINTFFLSLSIFSFLFLLKTVWGSCIYSLALSDFGQQIIKGAESFL